MNDLSHRSNHRVRARVRVYEPHRGQSNVESTGSIVKCDRIAATHLALTVLPHPGSSPSVVTQRGDSRNGTMVPAPLGRRWCETPCSLDAFLSVGRACVREARPLRFRSQPGVRSNSSTSRRMSRRSSRKPASTWASSTFRVFTRRLQLSSTNMSRSCSPTLPRFAAVGLRARPRRASPCFSRRRQAIDIRIA